MLALAPETLTCYAEGVALLQQVQTLDIQQQQLTALRQERTFLMAQLRQAEQRDPATFDAALAAYDQQRAHSLVGEDA